MPAGGSCRVTLPATVRVTIGGERYTLTVSGPKTLAAGRSGVVRVSFPRSAALALRGRRVTPSVRVRTVSGGVTAKTLSVKRTIRAS